MEPFQKEELFEYFGRGHVSVKSGDMVRQPVTEVSVTRDDDHDLRIAIKSDGWSREDNKRYPAGTLRIADEAIEFEHLGGAVSIARGVIYRGHRSSSKAGQLAETLETYSAHSIEIDFKREKHPCYTIEWVGNLPKGYIWTSHSQREETDEFTHTLGEGEAEIKLTRSSWASGGTSSLHIKIADTELYIVHANSEDTKHRNGQIIYKGYRDEEFRKKVRNCVSFALGIPIIYYGHTDYSDDWMPTFMKSIDAFTDDGKLFKLYDEPPYPINLDDYANVISEAVVNQTSVALFNKYEELQFNQLSWLYWYARCAPLHTSAVCFGGLIEQLQRAAKLSKGLLLNSASWQEVKCAVHLVLSTMDIDPEVRKILDGKISSANQAPPGLALKRAFLALNLRIEAAETDAWKERNAAAHGGTGSDPTSSILNGKILRILFHRLLAGITQCNSFYIDYYNLEHPVRRLSEAVPKRA